MIIMLPRRGPNSSLVRSYGDYDNDHGWNPVGPDYLPPYVSGDVGCSSAVLVRLSPAGTLIEWGCNLYADHDGPHAGWGTRNSVFEWDDFATRRITIDP